MPDLAQGRDGPQVPVPQAASERISARSLIRDARGAGPSSTGKRYRSIVPSS